MVRVTRATSIEELAELVLRGDRRSVGRAISVVERDEEDAARLLGAIPGRGRGAHVIGLTGPPGVGKSTTTSALVKAYRDRGRRVAVLAIDPSSPINGGALLGDRIRMREHALDPDVFIRSMASRGHLGGLAVAAPQALHLLSAAGFDVLLLETVGVGQSEVEISRLADTTVVLMAPGAGDDVQAAKAGIMEIGDIFTVNKADQDGATRTARHLRRQLSYERHAAAGGPMAWDRPVVSAIAAQGEVDALLEVLELHWQWLTQTGALAQRRTRRAEAELEAAVFAQVRQSLHRIAGDDSLRSVAGRVSRGETDSGAGAARLLEQIR